MKIGQILTDFPLFFPYCAYLCRAADLWLRWSEHENCIKAEIRATYELVNIPWKLPWSNCHISQYMCCFDRPVLIGLIEHEHNGPDILIGLIKDNGDA
jgi:hypothetical protein